VAREGGGGGGEKPWGGVGEEGEGGDEGVAASPRVAGELPGLCEEGVPASAGTPAPASPPGR